MLLLLFNSSFNKLIVSFLLLIIKLLLPSFLSFTFDKIFSSSEILSLSNKLLLFCLSIVLTFNPSVEKCFSWLLFLFL